MANSKNYPTVGREKEKKVPSAAELKRVKEFLLWAKEKSIQLHEVDFGSVKLTLTDLEILEDIETVNPAPDGGYTEIEKPDPKSFYDELARRRGAKV